MNLTTKQLKIMIQVEAGNGRDESGNTVPVDLDQLIERLDYQPTKQSLQFSLRALVKHQLIFKGPTVARRGRNRVTYLPTDSGRSVATGRPVESLIEPESVEEMAGKGEISPPAAFLEIIE